MYVLEAVNPESNDRKVPKRAKQPDLTHELPMKYPTF